MSHVAVDNTSVLTNGERWRRSRIVIRRSRFQLIAVACCLLATTGATLLALSTLVATKSDMRLVSVYLLPPAEEAVGVCSPYHPMGIRLFGLLPFNVEVVKGSAEESGGNATVATLDQAVERDGRAVSSDAKKAFSEDEVRLTNWRHAIAKCGKTTELVVHVSSIARIEHDEVVFIGRNGSFPSRVTFKELLKEVERSSIQKSLVLLDIFWPLASERGECDPRFKKLSMAIRDQFSRLSPPGCQVLFAVPGEKHSGAIAGEPHSFLCKLLNSATESSDCDSNNDGRTSIREIVQCLSNVEENASGLSLFPSLSLLGDECDFGVPIQRPREDADRFYPDSLAHSWALRKSYLDSIEIDFLPETALKWGAALIDLESRWRRGESAININAEAARLDAEVLREIATAIKERRTVRSDSLTISSYRFPFSKSQEALVKAVELISRQNEIYTKVEVSARDAATTTIVAQYVTSFSPEDAAMALNGVLETIERTTSLDAAQWDLICKLCDALPALNDYPVVEAVKKLAKNEAEYDRISKRLSLFYLSDRMGLSSECESILRQPVIAARDGLLNAETLSSSTGMVSVEAEEEFVTRAIAVAEAVVAAERNIGTALRRVQTVLCDVSIDKSFGVGRNSSLECGSLIASVGRIVDILERIKEKSASQRQIPTTELAFLRQSTEVVERLIARRVLLAQRSFRKDPLVDASVISCFVGPQERVRSLSGDTGNEVVQTVSIASVPKVAVSFANPVDIERSDLAIADLQERVLRLVMRADSGFDVGSDLPIAVWRDLSDLSWDNPEVFIEISMDPRNNLRESVRFQFLSPSSSSLKVQPACGELVVGKTQRIHVSLCKNQDDRNRCELNGLWLKTDSKFGELLTAIAITPQKSQPTVDIDFGDLADVNGREVRIPVWPSNQTQSWDWHLSSSLPHPTKFVVTVSSENGASVVSQPIDVSPDKRELISFPVAKPTDAAEVGMSLEFPFTVTVNDSNDATVVGQWTVNTEVLDPRGYIRPGVAEFHVESDGTNRLTVEINRLANQHSDLRNKALQPIVRLGLERKDGCPLLGFGDSKLQAEVADSQETLVLFAENLQFVEGSEAVQALPISINGDSSCFELLGRFPRRAGTVKLYCDEQPQLRVQAAAATTTKKGLSAIIEARNLVDSAALVAGVYSLSDSSGEPLWEARLGTSREVLCTLDSAGANATFMVDASRRDWMLDIPTDYGTGAYALRVSTANETGASKPSSEHRFLVDDEVPKNIFARADVSGDETIVHISCFPSQSGISTLAAKTVVLKDDDKTSPLEAQSVDNSGASWQIAWPAALPLPQQVDLSFVTGAGKEFAMRCNLPVRRIAQLGRITGQVFEGEIAQPQLTVTLRNSEGIEVAKFLSDSHGRFEFSVPPGQYQLSSEKAASQRSAVIQVTVEQSEVRTADLLLKRVLLRGA